MAWTTSPRFTRGSRGDVYVALSNGHGFVGTGQKWHSNFCFGSNTPVVGDFNGDGRDDIAALNRGSRGDVYVALSGGNTFGASRKWHDNFCFGNKTPLVGDFNGDGRDDLVSLTRGNSGDVYVVLSGGSHFEGAGQKWHDWFCVGNEVPMVGDFNGDGIDDLATFTRGNRADVYVAYSDGRHFTGTAWKWFDSFCQGGELPRCGDFDGDGRTDFARFNRGNRGDVFVVLSNGGQTYLNGDKWHDWFSIGNEIPLVGDFNGDGRDDVVTFTRGNRGDVYVALSSGQAFEGTGKKWHDWFCIGSEVPLVGDFNGDGMDDIATFTRGSRGDVYVALSNGHGFVGTGQKWHSNFCFGSNTPVVGDFNGDGRDDIAALNRGSRGDVYVALSTGYKFGASKKWHDDFCFGNKTPMVGDFNGDGKDDLAAFSKGRTGDVYVVLSGGSQFKGAGKKWHDWFCIGGEVPLVADFNGDGKDDLATLTRGNRGDVYVAISNGSKFRGTGWRWHEDFCFGSDLPLAGDFDRDGQADLARFTRGNTGDVYVALAADTGHYLLDEHHGGRWVDAEKLPGDTDDDSLCWAAAASNVLEWTGWGLVAGMTCADQIFDYFQDHWTDDGGHSTIGWNWWFSGANTGGGAQVNVPGGAFFLNEDLDNYLVRNTDDSQAMDAIRDYIREGRGVTLSIAGPGNHGITCWGYKIDKNNPGKIEGIYVTDSDDDKYDSSPEDQLRYYEVDFSGDSWHLQNYGGTNDWFIRGVYGLAPRPQNAVETSWDDAWFAPILGSSGWLNSDQLTGNDGCVKGAHATDASFAQYEDKFHDLHTVVRNAPAVHLVVQAIDRAIIKSEDESIAWQIYDNADSAMNKVNHRDDIQDEEPIRVQLLADHAC